MIGIRIFIGVLLVLIIGYGLVEAFPLFQGPRITYSSPKEYGETPDGFVTLSGRAKNTETLQVNGQTLLIDESGHFDTQLLFPPGGSILSLTATDRFGRTVHDRRTIYAL